MPGQQIKMLFSIVIAVLLGFALLGLSHTLFPDETSQELAPPGPIQKQKPLIEQILWAFQWIGLAALVSVSVVGAFLLINRVKAGKMNQ